MANICIIPARGGSKRIPKKNIKNFLGKPIIAYSIEAALTSGIFDEVMVSTDSEEIAMVAKQYGASVPFLRSVKNSDDFATTFDVIAEVLNQYDHSFNNVCCFYPCAPFVSADILKKASEVLTKTDADTVMPIIPYGYPIQRALKLDDNKVSFISPENALTRSQDLTKSFHDAGQFYFSKVDRLLKSKRLITENTAGIEISELAAQDIDNEIDWSLAELKYQLLHK